MIDAIVFDIEGTTTPISFVKGALFPLARRRLRSFVEAHEGEDDVRAALDAARALMGAPAAATIDVIAALERWIDEDRKHPPLKSLQGLIWRDAYATGNLKAPVYEDVPSALAQLRAEGARLAIYSSGSVLAQELLFAHTTAGDLTSSFEAWFDATFGPKTASESYLAISRALGVAPERIAFLSDSPAELDAALAAGLAPVEVVRDGAVPSGRFGRVTTFAGLARSDIERVAREGALARREQELCESLIGLAHECHQRGWVMATSGNFSVRLGADRVAVSASGKDKGRLGLADLGLITTKGARLGSEFRPSAEAPLHAALYRRDARIGAVAHTHSIAATLLSRRHAPTGELRFVDFEMQKALSGRTSHEQPVVIPIYRATQDIDRLAREIETSLPAGAHGYLVEGHGLTTWGDDIDATRRHLEAFEFLLACLLADR